MVNELRAKRRSSGIHWDFILSFIAILALWLMVGHTILYNFAEGAPLVGDMSQDPSKARPLGAFLLFLVIYALMFYLLGSSVRRGFLGVLLGLLGFFIMDIWAPPIVIHSGIHMGSLTLLSVGSMILIGSMFFFILANRINLPGKLYLFGGMVLLGILLLTLGIDYKYSGDPFQASCDAEDHPQFCRLSGGGVRIPSNLAISADGFLYLFFRNILRFPHFLAWVFTYLVMPVGAIIVFGLFMTRKQLKNAMIGNGL